jgi:phosphatidylinositol glycan class K
MLLQFILTVLLCLCSSTLGSFEKFAESTTRHTNNWAILVDTSRFWFNYRHVANVLSIYRSVKRLGNTIRMYI